MRSIPVTEAKARFGLMLHEIESGDHHSIVIERRDTPFAARTGTDDLARLQAMDQCAPEPQGALALVGAWADLMIDDASDARVRDICAQRERDMPRPRTLEEGAKKHIVVIELT